MARPRSEEARRRVVEATVDTLLDVGVEGATIEEIAERSGVARSTIYRHFGAREHLIVEAVRSCLVPHPTPDTGSLDSDIHQLFGRFDHEEHRVGNELLPLLLDERRRDEAMAAEVEVLLEERRRPIRTVLKLAQLRGEIDPELDLEIALTMVVGPLTYRRMVQGEKITDDFIAIVLPGAIAALRSTAGSFPVG